MWVLYRAYFAQIQKQKTRYARYGVNKKRSSTPRTEHLLPSVQYRKALNFNTNTHLFISFNPRFSRASFCQSTDTLILNSGWSRRTYTNLNKNHTMRTLKNNTNRSVAYATCPFSSFSLVLCAKSMPFSLVTHSSPALEACIFFLAFFHCRGNRRCSLTMMAVVRRKRNLQQKHCVFNSEPMLLASEYTCQSKLHEQLHKDAPTCK